MENEFNMFQYYPTSGLENVFQTKTFATLCYLVVQVAEQLTRL